MSILTETAAHDLYGEDLIRDLDQVPVTRTSCPISLSEDLILAGMLRTASSASLAEVVEGGPAAMRREVNALGACYGLFGLIDMQEVVTDGELVSPGGRGYRLALRALLEIEAAGVDPGREWPAPVGEQLAALVQAVEDEMRVPAPRSGREWVSFGDDDAGSGRLYEVVEFSQSYGEW